MAEKQLALRFIVHIVDDLHQPLHAGNGTDRGGNDRKVTFSGDETNLHAVWDTGLVESLNLSYTELATWLGAKITRADVKAWADPDPLVWIAESAAIRDTIYPESDRLSWSCTYRHMPTVKRRLSQAGLRVAAYLNEVWR